MEQNTVFISYRRSLNRHLARSIYMDLKSNGWDVFLDVNTMDNGDFDQIILNQIGARAHFILLISSDALARCVNDGDWVLRELQEAVRLDRNIVPIVEEGADFIHEIGYLPPDLREVISKKNALPLPHFYFDAAVEMLRHRFLKIHENIEITVPPAAERAEVKRRMGAADKITTSLHPSALNLMPPGFAWVDIPGKVYSIAKYPITNAQFAKFIEAGGYSQAKWWTYEGWTECALKQWTEPRFWRDSRWNHPEQPVVGVSWYEALAFCLWLRAVSGENIALPTEEQWQYAAQGDTGRYYPWGSRWDVTCCNNDVDGKGIGRTTPVRQYENKGASIFGVVDMCGNVWEWCLTDFQNKTNDMNNPDARRSLRGGSWTYNNQDYFRCDMRYGDKPLTRNSINGFRIVRINKR